MTTLLGTLLAKACSVSESLDEPSTSMKPKPTELPSEQQPIRLSVNTLLDGKFIPAGEPLPVSSSDDLPPTLRPFVVTTEDEPESEEVRANYELNTVYQVNSDGRLGRVVARQVAQMEAQAEQQAWVEEQLSEPLPRRNQRCLASGERRIHRSASSRSRISCSTGRYG